MSKKLVPSSKIKYRPEKLNLSLSPYKTVSKYFKIRANDASKFVKIAESVKEISQIHVSEANIFEALIQIGSKLSAEEIMSAYKETL